MTGTRPLLFQRTGRDASPHAVPVSPHLPAATGAVAGNLHLVPAEEEAIAAYLARVWRGATGQPDVPSPEQLSTLVALTLRKAREAGACRNCKR